MATTTTSTAAMGGQDLASFLRTWRGRVQPSDAGFRSGRDTRRTPGLRREEVAWLAGVSPDYVKRLEQGRAHPSFGVLRALARALQLSQPEFELACRLAGHAVELNGLVPQHIGPGVQRILARLSDAPIGVFDAAWTLLTHNEMWGVLMGGTRLEGRWSANLVWRSFHGDDGRVRHPSLHEHQASLVADLRDGVSRYPADTDLAEMVATLRHSSEDFAALWNNAAVAHYRSNSKTVDHPDVGAVELDCDIMSVQESDLRLVIFTTAAGSAAADKLDLLRVIGLQNMATSPQPHTSP